MLPLVPVNDFRQKSLLGVLVFILALLCGCEDSDGPLYVEGRGSPGVGQSGFPLFDLSECNALNGTNYAHLISNPLQNAKPVGNQFYALYDKKWRESETKSHHHTGTYLPKQATRERRNIEETQYLNADPTLGDIYLPFPSGTSYTFGQGWGGSFSHFSSYGYYAVDISVPQCNPITAVYPGRVIYVKEDSKFGGPADAFGSYANVVVIDHGDQAFGVYAHMCTNCALVSAGDTVVRGQVIGLGGDTGYSAGAHLHFQMNNWETGDSYSKGFVELSDATHATVVGENYTSQNSQDGSETYTESIYPAATFSGNFIEDYGFSANPISWYSSLQAGVTFTITPTISSTAPSSYTNAWAALVDIETNELVYYVNAASGEGISFTPPSSGTYFFAVAAGNAGSFSFSEARYVYVAP